MSLFGSPADVVHLDLVARGLAQRRAFFAVTVRARAPDRADQSRQLLVARTGAQHAAQIRSRRGEETGVQLAVRRQARARAATAEGLRHGCDHTDLALPVRIRVTLRDLAAVALCDGTQRPARLDAREQLRRGHDVLASPVIEL